MQSADYTGRYNTIRFTRQGGVLELALHTRGGEAKWGSSPTSLHAELGRAFLDIARDIETRVVIITGTGESFCTGMDPEERAPEPDLAQMWDRIHDEGLALLENLLAIPVPVIGAVNGPAYIHAEIAVLSDIVLAAAHAEFADLAHAPGHCVPGDGVHTVWPMLLGPNRGRYFLLTGQKLSARQALELGVVAEVLPAAALMPRARELAAQLARLPRRQLRHTRAVLVRHLRRRLREDLDFGLLSEALAMV
ncbi:enoyl-CoA hydratase/isomerase family protein [Acidocella sp.]|uniref:enoyl-CoA hydratase/isomerase family protein n=1 Tax=Acidocella sp. TaxID=50710 RepID=UPI002622848B|nr:enoyl-CoA hydratase/isomerase family protein [Acidocella sp.]